MQSVGHNGSTARPRWQKRCRPSDWWRTVVLALTRHWNRTSHRSGPMPWSRGVHARCRVHWPPRLVVKRRLGALSQAQPQGQPKKMLFAKLSGWVCGAVPVEVRLAQRRCPWGPACACDGGPAFQRRLLGSPCCVPSAERPLDKNAVRPALSSSLLSCRLREVRRPSIPFLPSFGLDPGH
jgi:hypothetical protein